ncbi:helix-turn-helix domain-containing protein [Pelagibius litoralis]|uniref:Helix-turn-helix domain-containing protein n=1 Tax=Pelagibius litoralis TaxID=374515 RepID=A0A967F3Q4_9PROT|nr:GyrI-like domain-containing protein [Pelagibius litoralis]NIA72467.1 helix-turn-helix domain-containing protein [Pelagibius litoralis]
MSQRETTRQTWLARFTRVTDYVTAHLDEDLDLDHLAEVACLSPYHFHRCWQAFTGETLAQMVTRLRLHHAAADLIRGEQSVEEVAHKAGYGSTAAFTRAFSRAFGRSPAAYRAKGRNVPPLTLIPEIEGAPLMHDVRIEETLPITLAAIRHIGPYMEVEKPFNQVLGWAMGAGVMTPKTRVIGVYHDDPGEVAEAELRSDVGIAVAPGTATEAPVHLVEVPGGRHAVLRFKGAYAELLGAYNWFFGTWLPESGHEPGDAPCYEDYLTNPREVAPSENITDIHIPLKG